MRADGLDRAEAVGAAPELADHEPGTAVDADAQDTVHRLGVFDALDRLELARLGGEEDGGGAAGPRLGDERGGVDLFTECGAQRELVEIHAERGEAELRVVAASEPGGDLDHLRPVRE